MGMRYDNYSLAQLQDKNFFFDTNVLLDLFYTHTVGWSSVAYSKVYKYMVSHQMKMYLDNTVLSEFINRILRIEYKLMQTANPNADVTYKNYRNTSEGQEKVEEAYNLVTVILKCINLDGEILSPMDVQSLLVVDEIDYNDKIIEHLCIKKGYILVTNDIDFTNSVADILSANRNLFMPPKEDMEENSNQ